MAKEIATKETVFAAADQLLSDGVAVTIKSVQSRVGGGSFTTVKRYLDEWMKTIKDREVQAADLPEQLNGIMNRAAVEIWCIARAESRIEVTRLQQEMQQAKAAQETQLKEALDEVHRLEKHELLRIDEMRALAETVKAAELCNAALSERLRAAEAVQEDLRVCRDQLQASQEKLIEVVARAARLEGQMTEKSAVSASRKREDMKSLVGQQSGAPPANGQSASDS